MSASPFPWCVSAARLGPALIVGGLALAAVACQHAHLPALPVPPAGSAALGGLVQTDRRGPPLPAALVVLTTPANTWRDSTFTDSRGRFVFIALAPGDYIVDVRRIGARRERRSVTLAPNSRSQLRFALRPDSLGLHSDCLAPDGRSMGDQFCR